MCLHRRAILLDQRSHSLSVYCVVREGRLPEMDRLYNVRARISYRLRLWHRDRALGLSYLLRLWHRDRALGQQTLDFDTLFLC